MTSFDQFLESKRRERKRGKLAGVESVVQELRARGASFREISEYLLQENGIAITPRGVAKHARSRMSVTAPQELPAPDPSTYEPPVQSALPERIGHGSPQQGERIDDAQKQATAIPSARGESSPDDVVTRYRLGSPEHQQMMAIYRQRKTQSRT